MDGPLDFLTEFPHVNCFICNALVQNLSDSESCLILMLLSVVRFHSGREKRENFW